MTLEEVYTILEGRVYYETNGMRKFSFKDNSIHIDRRAFIPFSIYKEGETFFLAPDVAIAEEKDLRMEFENKLLDSIYLYGKSNGERLLTLKA